MITDLVRNDLGRVCEYGSVEVAEMLALERFEQVTTSSLLSGAACAPKSTRPALSPPVPWRQHHRRAEERAMEIIGELEQAPRGIYCGAIGWLGYNGESSLSIAIRTLVRSGDRLVYQVGAGIVADSDPEKEYEETLHKAAGIRLAIERWQASEQSGPPSPVMPPRIGNSQVACLPSPARLFPPRLPDSQVPVVQWIERWFPKL